MTLTGAIFVRNANVEDMQRELSPTVNRLRFRRIVYQWNPYAGGLRYDLGPPADRKIARWDGTAFTVTKN